MSKAPPSRESDDAVIGRALKKSLLELVLLAIAVAGGYYWFTYKNHRGAGRRQQRTSG